MIINQTPLLVPILDASSEYLSALDLTDSEDVGRNGSIVSAVQDMTGPQVAVMGGSYGGLSPMIIMNNFVLKQVKYTSAFLANVICDLQDNDKNVYKKCVCEPSLYQTESTCGQIFCVSVCFLVYLII